MVNTNLSSIAWRGFPLPRPPRPLPSDGRQARSLSAFLHFFYSSECQRMSIPIERHPPGIESSATSWQRKGIKAPVRTTGYNPAGSGQAERCNGLRSKNLPSKNSQDVLPDVMHYIRSLLCKATNERPHEQLFGFPLRSCSGTSIPTWLDGTFDRWNRNIPSKHLLRPYAV